VENGQHSEFRAKSPDANTAVSDKIIIIIIIIIRHYNRGVGSIISQTPTPSPSPRQTSDIETSWLYIICQSVIIWKRAANGCRVGGTAVTHRNLKCLLRGGVAHIAWCQSTIMVPSIVRGTRQRLAEFWRTYIILLILSRALDDWVGFALLSSVSGKPSLTWYTALITDLATSACNQTVLYSIRSEEVQLTRRRRSTVGTSSGRCWTFRHFHRY